MMMGLMALLAGGSGLAWGDEVCSEEWVAAECDLELVASNFMWADSPFTEMVDNCINASSSGSFTCCLTINEDLATDRLEVLRRTNFTTSTDVSLILRMAQGGQPPTELELDETEELCQAQSGFGRCYFEALTLCPADLAVPVDVQDLDYTVSNLTSSEGGLTLSGLRFSESIFAVTDSNVLIRDSAFSNLEAGRPLTVDGARSVLQARRSLFCTANADWMKVDSLGGSPGTQILNSVFVSGADDEGIRVLSSSISLWNNTFVNGPVRFQDPTAVLSTGGNNLFWNSRGLYTASDNSAPPLESGATWSHNAALGDNVIWLGETLPVVIDEERWSEANETFDCQSPEITALFASWPYPDTTWTSGHTDEDLPPEVYPLVPRPGSLLVVAGTKTNYPALSDEVAEGQPMTGCVPDIGAFGGPYALASMWSQRGDEDCLEDLRDCADEDATTYLWVQPDMDGDGSLAVEVCADTSVRPLDPELYGQPDPDCDDSDATRYPSAEDICNGRDDDCDDELDEAEDRVLFYLYDEEEACYLEGEGVLSCAEPVDGGPWAADVSEEMFCGAVTDSSPTDSGDSGTAYGPPIFFGMRCSSTQGPPPTAPWAASVLLLLALRRRRFHA